MRKPIDCIISSEMQDWPISTWGTARPSRRKWVIRTMSVAAVLVACYLLVQLFWWSPLGGLLFPDQWVKRQQRKSQESFTFYGQVVDSSGSPIPEVKITIHINRPGTDPSTKRVDRVTDENGRFEVSDKGRSIAIREVLGPGHLLYDMDTAQYKGDRDSLGNSIRRNTRSFDFSETRGTRTYRSDKDRPAVFVLVQTGDVIKVWPSRGGSEEQDWDDRTWLNHPIRPREPSVEIIDTPEGPIAGDPVRM